MPRAAKATGPRRRPGRPRAAPGRDVRGDLLAAARRLFLRYGYRAVSARQVALAAGTTPAMVQYYFGSKQGLYAAMLQDAVAPLLQRVEAMLMAPSAEVPDLPALLEAYMRTVAAHPWVPGLLLRDVPKFYETHFTLCCFSLRVAQQDFMNLSSLWQAP